jgi:hypothetical protein
MSQKRKPPGHIPSGLKWLSPGLRVCRTDLEGSPGFAEYTDLADVHVFRVPILMEPLFKRAGSEQIQ